MELSTASQKLIESYIELSAIFTLKIDRDDMPADISLGDFLLFDATAAPSDQSLVLALVEGAVILRRYVLRHDEDHDQNSVRLISSNPHHDDIVLGTPTKHIIIAVAIEHHKIQGSLRL